MKKIEKTPCSVALLCGVLLIATSAHASEYSCIVSEMYNGSIVSAEEIKQGQFSIKIREVPEASLVSRCSFEPSAGKVTCDKYEVDKVIYDRDVKIKKFYVFRSQFDVQIFSDLRFIENNGRGGIAKGSCKIVAP